MDSLLQATEGDRGVVERKVRVVVVVVVVVAAAAAAANDGEPEEPRVVVVVAATEVELEGVVEATVLVQVVVVGGGGRVWRRQVSYRRSGVCRKETGLALLKSVMFVQTLAHFTT